MKNHLTSQALRHLLERIPFSHFGFRAAFFGLAILAVKGEAAEVTAKVSADSVQVAQPFTLDVTVTAAPGSQVSFPVLQGQLGDFEIRDIQDRFDIPAANGRIWSRSLTLESITTGDLEIPSLSIQVNENKHPSVMETQPVAIHVISVLEDRSDPTKFRDIHSVMDIGNLSVPSHSWLWWSLGGVAGMAALAGLVMVSRRGKWLTPYDWAIAELNQVKASLETNQIASESVSQSIAEVMRNYLQMQFGIADAGCTSQELLQQITARKTLTVDSIARLGNLFALADQVRFAGWTISTENLRSAIRDASELVQEISAQVSGNPDSQPQKPLSSSAPVSSNLSSHTHSEAV